MAWVFFWSVVCVIVVLWLTLWVTKKAYSRKWEDSEERQD
jgi:hypothetical protein